MTQQVMSIIADVIGVDADTVTMESTLEELGADSLDELAIVVQIEERLALTLDLDDVQPGLTVAQIVTLVEAATV